MTTTPIELVRYIDEIDALLATPDKWTQGHNARDENGYWVKSSDPRAVCWCINGAIGKVTMGLPNILTGLVCIFTEVLKSRGIKEPSLFDRFNDGADFPTIKRWISDARNLAKAAQ